MEQIKKQPKEKYTIEDIYSMSEELRVELIDGVLYDMASPSTIHQALIGELYLSIRRHIDSKGGGCRVFMGPFGVQPNADDDMTLVEPDISVICDKDKLTERGCVGNPDWIIEIVSPGNARRDYIDKLGLYMRSGVREYWIVDPVSKRVTVYRNGEPFIPEIYTLEDVIKAGIYDNLYIDFREIMKGIET